MKALLGPRSSRNMPHYILFILFLIRSMKLMKQTRKIKLPLEVQSVNTLRDLDSHLCWMILRVRSSKVQKNKNNMTGRLDMTNLCLTILNKPRWSSSLVPRDLISVLFRTFPTYAMTWTSKKTLLRNLRVHCLRPSSCWVKCLQRRWSCVMNWSLFDCLIILIH